jgi:hypothetical protein
LVTTINAFVGSPLLNSLLISTGDPVSAAGAGAQGTRPPAPARASTTQQPADGGWPRAYVTPSGARLVINESQIDSWLDPKRTAVYAAVSYTPADQGSTALGTISAEADTTNWDLFAYGSTPTYYLRVDKTSMTASNIEGPWKRFKTPLPAAHGAQPAGTAAAAPTVFVSQKPAELMLLNGVAAYTPVMGTRLEWVSNTDSDVFRLGTTGTVYYLVSGRWLSVTPVTVESSDDDAVECAAGYGARYDPWTGACTRSGAVYGPCGGAGYAARYNPRTGTYARGTAAWGPGGARGSTAVQRGNQWVCTTRVTNRANGATTCVIGTSGGAGAVSHSGLTGRTTVGTTGTGNVFAGHDGNV